MSKGTVITCKVPCAFAPARPDGSPGLHEVTLVMTENNKAVRYLSCACEDRHGKGVMNEMTLDGTTQDTCYTTVAEYFKSHGAPRDYPPVRELTRQTYYVDTALDNIKAQENSVRANRRTQALESSPDFNVNEALTNKVQRVTGNPLFRVRVSTVRVGTSLDKTHFLVIDGYMATYVAQRTHFKGVAGEVKYTLSRDVVENRWRPSRISCTHPRHVRRHGNAEGMCWCCGKWYTNLENHLNNKIHTKRLLKQINDAMDALNGIEKPAACPELDDKLVDRLVLPNKHMNRLYCTMPGIAIRTYADFQGLTNEQARWVLESTKDEQ